MADMTLFIGNKNYSSWSLRAWLAPAHVEIPFEESVIPLLDENWPRAIAGVSPSLKVPVLKHGAQVIWESLAILEYLAETFPEARLWPDEAATRAVSRAISAEMHAGFAALRTHMPLNVRKSLPGRGRAEGVEADIDRVCEIWRDARARFGSGGPFLFGPFTNADAMFAPVVSRFETYGVPLDGVCRAYAEAILSLDAMRAWSEGARAEPWVMEIFELA